MAGALCPNLFTISGIDYVREFSHIFYSCVFRLKAKMFDLLFVGLSFELVDVGRFFIFIANNYLKISRMDTLKNSWGSSTIQLLTSTYNY